MALLSYSVSCPDQGPALADFRRGGELPRAPDDGVLKSEMSVVRVTTSSPPDPIDIYTEQKDICSARVFARAVAQLCDQSCDHERALARYRRAQLARLSPQLVDSISLCIT